ncbi:hypothetical protein [Gilliamella sp. ESL0250]|uniref:hypothetical protein n=1 Tax=Gilliamella sp. ESL0250 TaxID=2705036 RepID=UPI0015806956|nr:hypothetical protein [Gilliamella sp. ESL0250]NUF49845.1 hypothetical protein [Gilliamella sp. ESL0250]
MKKLGKSTGRMLFNWKRVKSSIENKANSFHQNKTQILSKKSFIKTADFIEIFSCVNSFILKLLAFKGLFNGIHFTLLIKSKFKVITLKAF